MKELIPQEVIETKIYLVRGHKVMLDSELARLYGVGTKNLNKAINRNKDRFPEDCVPRTYIHGLLHGTWEPVALMLREKSKRGPVRMRVPRQGTGADYPVVAKKAGNAVGAKGVNGLSCIHQQPDNWED